MNNLHVHEENKKVITIYTLGVLCILGLQIVISCLTIHLNFSVLIQALVIGLTVQNILLVLTPYLDKVTGLLTDMMCASVEYLSSKNPIGEKEDIFCKFARKFIEVINNEKIRIKSLWVLYLCLKASIIISLIYFSLKIAIILLGILLIIQTVVLAWYYWASRLESALLDYFDCFCDAPENKNKIYGKYYMLCEPVKELQEEDEKIIKNAEIKGKIVLLFAHILSYVNEIKHVTTAFITNKLLDGIIFYIFLLKIIITIINDA